MILNRFQQACDFLSAQVLFFLAILVMVIFNHRATTLHEGRGVIGV